jgi:uncharacterized membrane protein YvbJ
MKFCENCGTQLADDATFCEECGTKQDVKETTTVQPEAETNSTQPKVETTATQSAINNVATQVENMMPKLSETCTPAKREIKGWLMILLLIICSPIVLANLILILPEFLFWVVYIGAQLGVLMIMWKKCNWKLWIKIAVIGVYILMYII